MYTVEYTDQENAIILLFLISTLINYIGSRHENLILSEAVLAALSIHAP